MQYQLRVSLGILFLFSNLVCVSSLSAKATAQNNRNTIAGTVFDTRRNPIPNLWIELMDEVDRVLIRVRTDSTGRYNLRGLSFGNFQVKVVTVGTDFVAQTARITLYPATMRGTGSHNELLDFTLKTNTEIKGATTAKSRATFVQEAPNAAQKAYERGVALLEGSKETEAGLKKLQEALELFPIYYLALERLGIEYVKQSQYGLAREVLQKALEVNPTGAPSLYAMGVLQYQTKQWKEAVDLLRRALRFEPESSNAAFMHFYLGLALLKTAPGSEAESHLKRANELGKTNIPADIHMHLAQYYSNAKRYKEAADELEMFLKRVPDAGDAENIRTIIRRLRAKA